MSLQGASLVSTGGNIVVQAAAKARSTGANVGLAATGTGPTAGSVTVNAGTALELPTVLGNGDVKLRSGTTLTLGEPAGGSGSGSSRSFSATGGGAGDAGRCQRPEYQRDEPGRLGLFGICIWWRTCQH